MKHDDWMEKEVTGLTLVFFKTITFYVGLNFLLAFLTFGGSVGYASMLMLMYFFQPSSENIPTWSENIPTWVAVLSILHLFPIAVSLLGIFKKG